MIHRLLATAIFLSTLMMSSIGMSAPAHAEGRVALVVGNSTYRNVSVLANPANDAADVSQSLRRLGFEVTTVSDAGFEALRRALIDFGRSARNADMAVMFFGGHGVEISGENWLLPVDAELKTDVDVNTEAINLRSAMQAVSNAKRLGLVILDACRNNPFAGKIRRSGPAPAIDTGLAPVDPGENMLVAYAARDGTVANDGAGRNSPYTTALLRHLETPGLEIEFLFRNVRDDVMNATNEEQQPFVYGSLSREEIYLKDAIPMQVASAASDIQSDAGEIAWSFLKATSDVGTLNRFVEQFPASSRVADAKVRIASLESAPALENLPDQSFALASTELDALTRQTTRPFVKNTPAVEAAWKVVKQSSDASVIRRFAAQFPSGQRQVAANQRLTEIGEPPIPRDLLLRAAADPDVIACYRTNNNAAPECQRAVARFPDIERFMSDFRFRFAFCSVLGELGHCNAVVNDAWSRPLFYPRHRDRDRPDGLHSRSGKHDARIGSRSKDSNSRRAGKEKSSKHVASNRRTPHARASSKVSSAKADKNGPKDSGGRSSGGGHHR